MLPASAMGGILENDPPGLQLVANAIGQRPVFLSPGFFTPGYHSAQIFIQRDGLSDRCAQALVSRQLAQRAFYPSPFAKVSAAEAV